MIAQMGIALFLTPYILRFVDKEQYGAYSLALSSIQFLALFNFGFGGALSVLVARNTKNKQLVSSYSSIVQTFQLFLGAVGVLFGIYTGLNFSDYFEIQAQNDESLRVVMIIFSISFFVTMINQVYSTLLVSYRQIALDNKIGIFTNLLGSASIVAFLQFGTGVIGLSLSLLLTQILTLVISYIRVKRSLPDIHVQMFKVKMKDLKELNRVGLWIFVGSMSVFLIEKFDQIVVGKIISLEMVSILVVTSKTFELARKLIFTITNNFRPYFGKLLEDKQDDLAKSYYIALRQLTVAISIVAASILILINPYFVEVWVELDFYGGDFVTLFLGLNLIYHAWKLPSRAFLSSHLIVKEQSMFGIVEGTINVLASIAMGKVYGLLGVVAGTFLSGFVLQMIFYGYLLNKKKLEKLGEYISNQSLLLGQLLIFGAVSIGIYMLLPLIENKVLLIPIFAVMAVMLAGLGYLLNIKQIRTVLSIKSGIL